MKHSNKKILLTLTFLFGIFSIHLNDLNAQKNSIKGILYGIGQAGNMGVYNGTSITSDPLPWAIKSVAFDPKSGNSWIIGNNGNTGIYDWEGNVEDRQWLGNWNLNSIAFNKKGDMWGVGSGGNIGKWNNYGSWVQDNNMSAWSISSIVFDKYDQLWCVGKGGNVGKWNDTKWESNPAIDTWKLSYLTFDTDGDMWCVGQGGNVGKWNGRNWEDLGFIGGWNLKSIFFRDNLKAGPVQGVWKFVCSNNCNKTISNSVTNQKSKTEKVSHATKTAISVSLEAGMELEGFSAKSSFSSSVEHSVSKELGSRVMNSLTNTETENVIYTPDQMAQYNIHSIWQWSGVTKMSNGKVIEISTLNYTCTADGAKPTYLPGSPEDIKSCKNKK